MEELLGVLIAMFLEVFGEALFQLAAEVIVALADRSIRRGFHEVVELGESGPSILFSPSLAIYHLVSSSGLPA